MRRYSDGCCLTKNCQHPPPIDHESECVWMRSDEANISCQDDYEPNGDLTIAWVSTQGHECSVSSKRGVIASDEDVDVFRTGTCKLGLGTPIGTFSKTLEPAVRVEATEAVRV